MTEELKPLMYVPNNGFKYGNEPTVKLILENWFKEPRELNMNRAQLVNVIKAFTKILEHMDKHNNGSV